MPSDNRNPSAAMIKIGEALKEARGKKSVTIDQVQKHTRIHSTVLKAIEDGRCDEILTPTYVKSFIKKYAEYLGLDARNLLGEYAKTNPAAPSPNIIIKSSVEPARTVNLSQVFPVIKTAVVALVIIAAAVVTAGGVIRAVAAIGKARSSSKAKANPGVIRPAAATTAKKKGPAKQVAQSQLPAKETAAVKAPPAPAAAATIPKATPIRLVLKVNRQTMIKLRVDGSLLFERVLPPGTVESFTANDRINIYTAKAEAIELSLNGKNLGSPGRGIMKNIEITRAGLKIK